MSSGSKKQKTGFVPGFRNGVGRPLAHGSDSAKSRKETIRRRNESQIYLLHAYAEWVAERATWALEKGRPINNADFAKHLLTDHAQRCSPQHMCSVTTQTEPSELPISCELPIASTALTSTPTKGHNSSILMPVCPSQVALPSSVEDSIDSLDENETGEEEGNVTWEEAVKPLHESGLPGKDMLSIKAEPEDTPPWEERCDGRIIQEGHADGTEICTSRTGESVASYLETSCENAIKKEEMSHPSQETGIDDATVQVTVHMEDDEFLTETTENKITAGIKEEDSDLGHEGQGSNKSPLHQPNGHQIKSSVTHPIYVGERTSGNTGVCEPSSELIVNDDPCSPLSSSQHLEFLTSGKQRNSFYQVSNEVNLQNAMKLEPVDIVNQCQLSENCVNSLDVSENICTHKKSLKCKLCEKSSSWKSASKELETNCTEAEKQLKLILCNKPSRGKCNLKMHAIPHTSKETFKCQHCEKMFNKLYDCQRHEVTHKDEKPFKCQFCGNSFKRKWVCQNHEKTHTGETPFKCQFCEKSFSRKQYCKNHEMTHTGERPFKCRFCEKSFSKKQGCICHERTHTGEKPYICQFCGKSFSRRQGLKNHEITHTSDKPFKCQFCEKSFRRNQNRKNHEMVHTGQTPFKCQFCEKSFSRIHDCQYHEMIHTGDKPFKCQFCEKSFSRKQNCENHETIHTGNKPFKCRFCEKSFSRKQERKYHEMTHTGEKPYKCQYCERSFSKMQACRDHERMHTGNRPFLCQFCDKGFTLKKHCRIHEITHTSEKPFKCQYCEKAFMRKQQLKYHEMIHTGEKPFKCQYCEKSFIRMEDCKRHMRRHLQARNASSGSIEQN